MNQQNKDFAEALDKILREHTERIHALILQCGALKAVQHRLFNVISETNAQAHSKIVDEIKSCISSEEAKKHKDDPAINHFRALIGEKPPSPVRLQLVPKKPPQA